MDIPLELQELFGRAAVEDRSFSSTAKTYRLNDSGRVLFVKFASAELLDRERLMSEFLHRHGLAPAVVGYGATEESATEQASTETATTETAGTEAAIEAAKAE